MTVPRDALNDHRLFFTAQPLFENIAPRSAAFRKFLDQVELVLYARSEEIYEPGTQSDYLYLVRDGEVHIVYGQGNGPARTIGIHGRGSIFGEVSFLTREPHSSFAVATLDSHIYRIPGEAFVELMTAEAGVGRVMTSMLSRRLRRSLYEESHAHPASIHALFYPEDPERGSEVCAALGEALVLENPGPVLILTLNPASMFAHHENVNGLSRILEKWPAVRIEEMLGYMDHPAGFDLLVANEVYGMELNLDRVVQLMPDFLGRLRKYYATILVDAGGLVENPVLSRVLSQSDYVMFVRNPHGENDSRAGRRFREVIAYCTELMDDFFERAIIISDECEERHGGAPADWRGWNPNSALYKRHMRLSCVSGGPAHRIEERAFQIGINRIARKLSGTSRGLVLGGGGARAFAHIGVMEVLDREGIDFDAVTGTSMGAVIGCGYAMGRDASELAYLVKQIIPDSDAILDKRLPLVSFFRGKKLNKAILSAFGNTRFEDLEIPFYCNAADLNTAQSVIFEQGFVSTAIRASVSLPGIFPPMKLGPYDLVDGGVLNNLPGDILRDKGFNRIIGVNVTPLEDHRSSDTQVEDRPGGLFQKIKDYFSLPPILKIIYRSTTIQGIELLKLRLDDFDYLFHPDIAPWDIFDFHRRDEIIEAGRRAALDSLQEIKDTLYRPRM